MALWLQWRHIPISEVQGASVDCTGDSSRHLLKRKMGLVSVPAEYVQTLAFGSRHSPPLARSTCLSTGILQTISICSCSDSTLKEKNK